jgi:hypothetical protein
MSASAQGARVRGGPTRAWLAWMLFAVTILFLGLGLLLIVLDGPRPGEGLYVLAFGSFSLTGLLVALRRPDNAVGWLCSAIGLSSTAAFFLDQYVVSALTVQFGSLLAPGWAGLLSKGILAGVQWIALFLVIMTFPNGAFLTRRWRLAGLIGVSLAAFYSLGLILVSPTIPGYPAGLRVTNPLSLVSLAAAWSAISVFIFAGMSPLLFSAALVPPVLRYRRARSEEREQLKWLAFATLPWLLIPAGAIVESITDSTLLAVLLGLWALVCITGVSVAIAIAILRYRLYDIDLIIRRTLIYGALTALLAGVYFGGVALAQALLRPLTGAGNDLAIVVTTLGIAALVLPLRRAVQGFIDRRFYRGKYNAARTLAAFGARARDEVELEALTGRLLDVVQETMHPAWASVWLPGDSARLADVRNGPRKNS